MRATDDPAAAIEAFWAWWAVGRGRVEAAIQTGEYGNLGDELGALVAAIDPDLEWELSQGHVAAHLLCVTSAGVAERRTLAERWRAAAPEPDAVWEYASARMPDPRALTSVLTVPGAELALADLRFGVTVDEPRQVLDLVVHHPHFVALEESDQQSIAYLTLDWILGEDGVERWVGSVDVARSCPQPSVAAAALPEILDSLRSRHPEPTWSILRGAGPDGRPVMVLARRPLKAVEFPLYDLHGVIELDFADQTDVGLPGSLALSDLRSFEDGLLAEVPEELALLAAHETHAGTRRFHLFCDSQGTGAAAIDDVVARAGWPGARSRWERDPGWEAIRPFQ
jgi:hypothetical protein